MSTIAGFVQQNGLINWCPLNVGLFYSKCGKKILGLKVAQNSFLLFVRLLELDAIFQAWNCTVLNGCAIFLKVAFHCTFHCV